MPDIKDDAISRIDRQIADLMEQRQMRLDVINDPVRIRIHELYFEIANRLDELAELGDDTHHMEEVYVGYDEHENQPFPVQFEGKYYTFNDGKIEAK